MKRVCDEGFFTNGTHVLVPYIAQLSFIFPQREMNKKTSDSVLAASCHFHGLDRVMSGETDSHAEAKHGETRSMEDTCLQGELNGLNRQ